MSYEQAKLKVWDFWKAGMSAEQRSDFAGALRAYEAIKALPVVENDWPYNLDQSIEKLKKKRK